MEEKRNALANNPDFIKALDDVIDKWKEKIKKAGKVADLKKSPIVNLYESGNLTREFILSEMPKLSAKTSTLPSGTRSCIAQLVEGAVAYAIILQKQNEEESDNNNQE